MSSLVAYSNFLRITDSALLFWIFTVKKREKRGQASFLYESGQGLIGTSEKGPAPFFSVPFFYNRILEDEDIIELHI